MFRFFRKLRKKLLSEGKFSRYLAYAFGEVFLVVVGILIALWINNANQEREQQVKIDAILVKIQNDFLQDLQHGQDLVENYMRKDAMRDWLRQDSLTPEDLRAMPTEGSRSVEFVTIWWLSFKPKENGYNQLMSMLDKLPPRYDELVKQLNTNHRYSFESFSKNSQDISRRYQYYLADNHSWYVDYKFQPELTDAHVDYILNNPRFKSQMQLLVGSIRTLFWEYTAYRQQLMQNYILINELLGDKATPLPKHIRTTSLADEKDAKRFVGTYRLTSGPEDRIGTQLEVFNRGKDLYFKKTDGEETGPLLFLDAEQLLFSARFAVFIVEFESNGENSMRIMFHDRDDSHWSREK
jgi:hypothetical protein